MGTGVSVGLWRVKRKRYGGAGKYTARYISTETKMIRRRGGTASGSRWALAPADSGPERCYR